MDRFSRKMMKNSVSWHDLLMKDLRNDPRAAIGYLNAALDEREPEIFLLALKHVAEAWGGMSKLARAAKLHRVNLHRMLSKNGNPEMVSLRRLLDALDLQLQVTFKKPLKKAA